MTRPYTLFCDSTCDLPEERLQKMDCRIIPLTFEIDGKPYTTADISMQEFYRRMREDASTKTSQISVGVCQDAFEEEVFSEIVEKIMVIDEHTLEFWMPGGFHFTENTET